MLDSIRVGCPHNPKTIKKTGIVLGRLSEILVCDSCKNDPDFSKFKEDVIQN